MFYLLLCRSLTYAQRSARFLERKGVTATVIKAPPAASANGCAYALRVAERYYHTAMELLRSADLAPKRVFTVMNGELKEVAP